MRRSIRTGSVVLIAAGALLAGCASETKEELGADSAAAGPTQPALDECAVVPTAGVQAANVTVNGLDYPTEIHQPAGRSAAPVAALIDLHGLDSNGPTQAALTRFRELADREGFVVAEPSGSVGTLGVTGWEIAALDEPGRGTGRDDLSAMDQLIDKLIDDECVDPDRIFVAGYSMGGFLAAELACSPGSRVAGILAVAGFHAPEPCERHVPTLVVHGTADPIVPLGPNGTSLVVDDTMPQAARELLASSIEQEVATSARGADCDDAPTSTELADDVTELRYTGCAGGAEHRLVLVEGGGHTWPGAAPAADADFVGATTTNFDATEASWDFFASHSGRP